MNASDRFNRVIGQTIAYSRTNDNTKGSKIEAELESVMKTISATADKLHAMEAVFLTPSNFTDQQLKEIAFLIEEMKKDTKVAKEKEKGLKSWFNL